MHVSPRQRRISSVMWGCITYNEVVTRCLVNGNINTEKYISILETYLWPVNAQHFSNKTHRFQHGIESRYYWLENNIPTIVWLSHSPDINIIENLWLRIKRTKKSATNHLDPWRTLCRHSIKLDFLRSELCKNAVRFHPIPFASGFKTKES